MSNLLLPVEMIDEILTHVDWETFMIFRTTSRLGKSLTDGARHQSKLREGSIKNRIWGTIREFIEHIAPESNKFITVNTEEILRALVYVIFEWSEQCNRSPQSIHSLIQDIILTASNPSPSRLVKDRKISMVKCSPIHENLRLNFLPEKTRAIVENFLATYEEDDEFPVVKGGQISIFHVFEILVATALKERWELLIGW